MIPSKDVVSFIPVGLRRIEETFGRGKKYLEGLGVSVRSRKATEIAERALVK